MNVSRCMIIAQKEFADHLTSKRFFVILALFLIISVIGISQGIGEYDRDLAAYQEKIAAVESSGVTGWMPDRPSVLSVYSSISDQIVIIGAVLAIAVGFDLVSKEKETKTLKTLLSHPVYRDEVINGKAIGGGAAVVLAIGLAILVSLAMLLIASIIPTINEFSAIATFGAVSILFLLIYFSLALTLSTLARDSGSALIATLVVFIILSSLLPLAGEIAIDTWAGERPDPPYVQKIIMSESGAMIPVDTDEQDPQGEKEAMKTYEAEAKVYYEKKAAVTAIVEAASPQTNYKKITEAVIDPYRVVKTQNSPQGPFGITVTDPDTTPPHFTDVLAGLWGNIALLLVLPGVLYLTAYLCFMRTDVR